MVQANSVNGFILLPREQAINRARLVNDGERSSASGVAPKICNNMMSVSRLINHIAATNWADLCNVSGNPFIKQWLRKI